jgi:hypothetical protein
MRMAVYQFFAGCIRHVVNIKAAGLTLDVCMKQNLHQHVAKLLAHVRFIVCVQGFTRFVDFLDKITPDALVRLDLIPGAALLRAKVGNEAHKILQAILVLALKI